MNYKTLLLGTALIVVATYGIYATVTPKIQQNNNKINLDNSSSKQTPEKKPVVENVMTTEYSMLEVSSHQTEDDCWTTVNGLVYDLTPFIKKHPGGKSEIMRICAIDGTKVFENQHGGQGKPENILAGLEIGILK
jgi:cytochrome b involved in lipid metabolism